MYQWMNVSFFKKVRQASSLNLSQFVEDQNGPSTSQILPAWPYWQWWGRAPPVRSAPPVQRHSDAERSARIERSRVAGIFVRFYTLRRSVLLFNALRSNRVDLST